MFSASAGASTATFTGFLSFPCASNSFFAWKSILFSLSIMFNLSPSLTTPPANPRNHALVTKFLSPPSSTDPITPPAFSTLNGTNNAADQRHRDRWGNHGDNQHGLGDDDEDEYAQQQLLLVVRFPWLD
ncbi:hypothetical protein Droror1_Dr00020197 [Drosera rotundifolia]